MPLRVGRSPFFCHCVGRGQLCCPFIAKTRADASHFLASPLAKGDALFNRGRHGAGKLRFVIEQRIIPGGHGDIHSCFQVSQLAQLANDPVADLLENLGNVGIAGRFGFDKAGLEAHFAAIEVDALKEDDMKMQIQIYATAKSLYKRDRSRLHLVPLDTASDCLIDVILCDGGADNGMHLCRQVTR